MEILGNNLKKFFDILDDKYNDAEITYDGDRYEVWEVSDELFERMCDMPEDEFVELAGEDAWWRSAKGSILAIPDTEINVHGKTLLGWKIKYKYLSQYDNLSDYLCCHVGASTPKNVCACAVDLAKYNNMTMAELFEKYES